MGGGGRGGDAAKWTQLMDALGNYIAEDASSRGVAVGRVQSYPG